MVSIDTFCRNSPDRKPFEQVWGGVTWGVLGGGKNRHSTKVLEAVVLEGWEDIRGDLEFRETLLGGQTKRVEHVM